MGESPATRASLLVRLRDPHDKDAWGQFVQLYAPVVYGFARKRGLQDADAADLMQEVFRSVAGAAPFAAGCTRSRGTRSSRSSTRKGARCAAAATRGRKCSWRGRPGARTAPANC